MIRLRNFEDSKLETEENNFTRGRVTSSSLSKYTSAHFLVLESLKTNPQKTCNYKTERTKPQKTCNYKTTERMSNEFRNNGTTTKTIYAIYYEDVKPVIKDLQSVPLCSHVLDATSMLKTLT